MDATKTKPFNIDKKLVYDAYKAVKANAGAAGVDGQSLEMFDKDLMRNLYKIWNRMSSGSYFPPPVRAVPIPKKSGGQRILGVPTVADRVAQMVVKKIVEREVEPIFLPDSYGYRPSKSAIDAIGVTRKRCWQYDFVLEFDIRGLFDNIDHTLLLRAVRKHVKCKWSLLYIERWLTAPMEMEDGTRIGRSKGTPQGGVVSPVLANLFLHYAFDAWMAREYPDLPWCRYADDGLVHCRTEAEAAAVKAKLAARFVECHLEMHPDKTKIVYCKDAKRKGKYPNTRFDFLGYCFGPKAVKKQENQRSFHKLYTTGQCVVAQVDAEVDQGAKSSQTHTCSAGGYSSGDQPNPSRLVELLRSLYPVSFATDMALRQRHIGRVGHAKVQALQAREDTGWPID